MARLTIAALRKKWALVLVALTRIKAKSANTPFGQQVDQLLKDIALERTLDNYIILEKDVFAAPRVTGLLLDLGVTPEKIKELALADGLVNSRVLEGGLIIDAKSELTDDNMIQLLKVLLYKDYEETPQ